MRHAPKGGISIDGDRYEGGQFLPESDFQRSKRRKAVNAEWLRPGRSVKIAGFCSDYDGVVAYVYPSMETVECRYKDEYGVERKTLFAVRSVTPNVQAQGGVAASCDDSPGAAGSATET